MPDPITHRERGNEFFRSKQYRAALDEYTLGIEEHATPELLCNRAACHLELGAPTEALVDARAALAIDPVFPRAHQRCGQALHKLDRLQAALEAFGNCCTLTANKQEFQSIHAVAMQQGAQLKSAIASLPTQTKRSFANDSERFTAVAPLMTAFLRQTIVGATACLLPCYGRAPQQRQQQTVDVGQYVSAGSRSLLQRLLQEPDSGQ